MLFNEQYGFGHSFFLKFVVILLRSVQFWMLPRREASMTEWGTLQAHTHGVGLRQQHIASLTDRHLLEETRTGTQCHRFQPTEPSEVLPPMGIIYSNHTSIPHSNHIATIYALILHNSNLIGCVYFYRQEQMLELLGVEQTVCFMILIFIQNVVGIIASLSRS